MSIGNGQSWPLFEYTGSTDIVWGYYDKDGNEIEFLPTEVHVEWEKRKSRLLKIAAMGLASAALSITVFFWPIAQGLA